MKRLSKRKLYQKRRKKEKAEERKKSTLSAKPATRFYKFNNDTDNKQYQRSPTHNNPLQQNSALGPITSYTQGLQMWWQTYCSAIEFHTKQQHAWKGDRKEQELRLLKKYADEYETSSEEDNDEYSECNNYANNLNYKDTNDEPLGHDVDEEYIKFLEITHKHREELRLKRAEENV